MIPKNGRKAELNILVRKLHGGIGLELDVMVRAMFNTNLLGGVYRADLDGSHEQVLFLDLVSESGVALAHFD